MPFTIEKKSFLDLLQKAYPFVPQRTSLQVLSNFMISLKRDAITITATDLDHSIRVTGELSGDEEYDVTVNARRLFDISRELPDGPLTIQIDENVVIMESANSFSCKIAGADTLDYPAFPEISADAGFTVPVAMLKDMISKTSFAVSKDETRACLCGVLWEIENQRTGMTATDGHRLGSSFHNAEIDVPDHISGIIAPKSILHLTKIVGTDAEEATVSVTMGEKYVLFSTDTITLCSKLIDGPYPDYEKVIPRNNPKKAVVDKRVLIDAVRRVSVLSNQKTHLTKFLFTPNRLEVTVLNRDIGGEARQVLEVEYEGEEHALGFNGHYLSEILNIVPADRVRIEMNTQISACLVFPENEEQTTEDLFLIMPLRIMEEA